ncbi:signal peptidase I [Marinicrinis lubricantis]|uniref:Signal peptidase I n=1 Tax=Marinicrinis lubricantis TaxID=2086470 RepID=A0ABW1IUR0_9BACL
MVRELLDWVKTIAIALVLVFLIKYFLLGNYQVDGSSMEPNFHDGERIIVNKVIYDIRDPKRGEVVVLHSPDGRDFIKRIIALPNEEIEVRGDEVYIDGSLIEEPYLAEVIKEAAAKGIPYNDRDQPNVKVPEDSYFVLGDNRSDSTDSRMIGTVAKDDIVGRADLIYWPLSEMELLPWE